MRVHSTTSRTVQVDLSSEEVEALRVALSERATLGASIPTQQWVAETRLWSALEAISIRMQRLDAESLTT